MSFMGETTTVPGTNRPRLLQAMVDAFRQADVRQKLLFTIGMLIIFRFVAHVPVPNVDRNALEQAFDGNAVLDFLSIFSGGALQNLSVAALGVYPYITASIIMQIVTPLSSRLRSLQEEGEQGRRRIQVYTHWLAVPLAFVQGYGQIVFINNQAGGASVIRDFGFQNDFIGTIATLFTLCAGTMFLVWLGELITEHGIGNGISLIIFGGIVAVLPGFVPNISTSSIIAVASIVIFAVVLIFVIVFFQEAQRRVPVQYARSSFRGGRMYRQQGQSFIPLRVNMAGMIPLIFAFSIVILPAVIAGYFSGAGGWVESVADFFVNQFQGAAGAAGRASTGLCCLSSSWASPFSIRSSSTTSRTSPRTSSSREPSSPASDPAPPPRPTSCASSRASPGAARSSSGRSPLPPSSSALSPTCRPSPSRARASSSSSRSCSTP